LGGEALHEAFPTPPAGASTCLRLRRSARSLDLFKYVTQLHRERTEQVAAACAVAGLARLLQRGGGAANANRTHRLRSALELVRDRRQLRKVASARGDIDLPLGLNCCFPEFPQQGIHGGPIVSKPSRKHVPVDCSGGLPLIHPIPDAALL